MNSVRAFDPRQLLDDARAAAPGLDDFGDPSFRPALEVLCDSLEHEAGLSPTGIFLLRQKILAQLTNRLRIEGWFHREPEIANEEVGPPLVIVGLPRTGTTKLHRLLSRDPRFWWMAFWESQFPVPLPEETLECPASRIAQAREMVDMMTTAMPKLMAIHPMAAEEADEEVMLMEHSLQSAFNAYANVPGYMRWLDAQDQSPAYRYLRRTLQFLQWQKRRRGIVGQRWVLKAPHHLLRMDVLLRVFPGAQIIQTHRDPQTSVPSLASFVHTLWGIYSDSSDAGVVGRSWSETMQRALAHTMSVREGAPEAERACFLDVRFEDTVRQPMEVVRRIYQFIGWTLDAAAEAEMRRWLVEDETSHKSAHDYHPEAFGLSAGQLRRDFTAYRLRHIDEADSAV